MVNTHPKIVELFGLPGCGKTTLRDCLILSSDEEKVFSLMTELTAQYKDLTLYKKIKHIPWQMWWKILLFFFSIPVLPVKEWVYYRVFFSFALIYHFSSYAKGTSIIINDHGFVQAVVSLMNGHVVKLSERQAKRFKELIQHLLSVTFIYCKLPADVSFQRIRSRKRNVGRLDVLKDDEELKDKLFEEERVFDSLFEGINAVDGSQCFLLDGVQDVENCSCYLKDLIMR